MKKTIAILITILLLFSLSVCYAAEINFTDVKTDDWYYKNLQELIVRNIVGGYPDETFRPDNNLKFEEFIKMLLVAITDETIESTEEIEWYQIYIDKAFEDKYINEQQKMLIGQNISRETMAEILYNVLADKEDITVYTDAELEYLAIRLTDINKAELKTLTINGIGVINGYPDGTFKPTGTLTRAEAIAVISRVINPELRNPIKIVLRENGIIDANDLESVPIEETNYDKLKEYVITDLHDKITYKVENVIKTDASMFPIRYGGLVITGIEKLPAEKAPYYGDTSIAWKNTGSIDKLDAIIIHAYAVEKSDDNENTTDYWVGNLLGAFVNKSGDIYTTQIASITGEYGGEAVYNKTKEILPDYALGYGRVELNQQFTTMIIGDKGFEIEYIDKIILMDTRGTYYPSASTNDVLEIDLKDVKVIK